MERHSHPHPHSHHGGTPLLFALLFALLITLGFAVVELFGGWWAHSLALLSDAGHMFSDALALGLAALAAWIARQPAGQRHSYGLVRAEVVAAILNGLILLAVIVLIVVEAVRRLREPAAVAGGGVMLIAGVGLLVNLLVAYILSRGEQSLNTRAALLHVIGDLIGSLAALLAGAVIYFTGWLPIDPILSLVIAALILVSTLRLLRDALHVLMEGVPQGLHLETVGRELANISGVRGVHDLHIWGISSGHIALSAHLELGDLADWPRILDAARVMLREQFSIEHVTLQPEVPGGSVQPPPAIIRLFHRHPKQGG